MDLLFLPNGHVLCLIPDTLALSKSQERRLAVSCCFISFEGVLLAASLWAWLTPAMCLEAFSSRHRPQPLGKALVDTDQNPGWLSDPGHTGHWSLSIWGINLWKNEQEAGARQ